MSSGIIIVIVMSIIVVSVIDIVDGAVVLVGVSTGVGMAVGLHNAATIATGFTMVMVIVSVVLWSVVLGVVVMVFGVMALSYEISCRISSIIVSFGSVAIVLVVNIDGVIVGIVTSKWLVGTGVCW